MEAQQSPEGQAGQVPERRAHPRYSVDESATLLLLSHGSCIAGRMIELSEGGCRLSTPGHFSAGIKTRVEIAFRIHGIAFRFGGVVEWTLDRHLIGVRFVEVPSRNRVELCDVLLEMQADMAATAAKESVKPFRAQPLNESRFREAEKHGQAQAAFQIKPRPSAVLAEPGSSLPNAVGPQMNPRRETLPEVQPAPVSQPPQSLPAANHAGRDRRAQTRLPVDTSADILLINIGCHVRGRIQDLSVGGCRIHTDERFPVGIYTRVETEFRLQGLPFRLSGVIQALHDQQRQLVGVRFLDMSARKREQVEQLIKEIEEA
ncbi:MAG: PilZ domain-containing protein [Terracidiphilus sp.]